jgi:hypothetical protein
LWGRWRKKKKIFDLKTKTMKMKCISIKMNGQWAALNTTPVGVNNTVRDIVIYNNQLVLGGSFTSVVG